jgi:hypothetical protein
MKMTESVIAVFPDHALADAALKALIGGGLEIKNLSIVGKGYHTEETAIGFYNIGDRMKIWGARGAFWGALWGFFLGGLFIAAPAIGGVLVLGYLATAAISAMEGAVALGGLSALGAALASLGVHKDSVVRYQTAIKADGFLLMAHGSAKKVERARAILAATHPLSLDLHSKSPVDAPDLVPAT